MKPHSAVLQLRGFKVLWSKKYGNGVIGLLRKYYFKEEEWEYQFQAIHVNIKYLVFILLHLG